MSVTRFRWLAAAAIAYSASLLLHLPVTDALAELLTVLGIANYELLLRALAVGTGVVTMGAIAWREDWNATPVVRTALVLLGFMALARALLIIAPAEYVHYAQYALVAFLVARAGIPLEWTWLAAVALGAVDEGYQFLVLNRGRPDYFDWNDVVINAVGAAFGLVILLAGRPALRPQVSLSTRLVVAIFAVALVVALASAPVTLTPFLTQAPRGRLFRVLSATEGVVWLGALWAVVRGLIRSSEVPQFRSS